MNKELKDFAEELKEFVKSDENRNWYGSARGILKSSVILKIDELLEKYQSPQEQELSIEVGFKKDSALNPEDHLSRGSPADTLKSCGKELVIKKVKLNTDIPDLTFPEIDYGRCGYDCFCDECKAYNKGRLEALRDTLEKYCLHDDFDGWLIKEIQKIKKAVGEDSSNNN